MRTAITGSIVALALLAAGAVRADEAWVSTGSYRPSATMWLLNWEIAGPIGDFGKYISDTSLRGFSVEGRSFVKENLTVGGSFSWNRYQQTYSSLTVPVGNGVATGPVYRYADMFALRALVHYYFGKGNLQPYLGAGIGGAWSYAYQQVADLSRNQSNFNFILSPEVGLIFRVAGGGTNAGLNVAFRYTYTTATVGTYKDAQTLSGIVGIAGSY